MVWESGPCEIGCGSCRPPMTTCWPPWMCSSEPCWYWEGAAVVEHGLQGCASPCLAVGGITATATLENRCSSQAGQPAPRRRQRRGGCLATQPSGVGAGACVWAWLPVLPCVVGAVDGTQPTRPPWSNRVSLQRLHQGATGAVTAVVVISWASRPAAAQPLLTRPCVLAPCALPPSCQRAQTLDRAARLRNSFDTPPRRSSSVSSRRTPELGGEDAEALTSLLQVGP